MNITRSYIKWRDGRRERAELMRRWKYILPRFQLVRDTQPMSFSVEITEELAGTYWTHAACGERSGPYVDSVDATHDAIHHLDTCKPLTPQGEVA